MQESSSSQPGIDIGYKTIRELLQQHSYYKQVRILINYCYTIILIRKQRAQELEMMQQSASVAEEKLQRALAELEELKASRERQLEVMRDYLSKRDSYLDNFLLYIYHTWLI